MLAHVGLRLFPSELCQTTTLTPSQRSLLIIDILGWGQLWLWKELKQTYSGWIAINNSDYRCSDYRLVVNLHLSYTSCLSWRWGIMDDWQLSYSTLLLNLGGISAVTPCWGGFERVSDRSNLTCCCSADIYHSVCFDLIDRSLITGWSVRSLIRPDQLTDWIFH